ncbi:MAG: hypothetical protein EAX90_11685 [Candidatus Heimdallarchaeota archaeon]|nr:hypothetical protein [Candidatus Heimdallarchaeota archaeon]
MGVSFKYSKKVAKTGTRLLIGLLVIDTTWSLVRFIIFNTVFGGTAPNDFVVIDSIITNILFTSFLGVLASGMLMLGIYYSKISKWGLIASILLVGEFGIKVAFIFFRFTQLIGSFYEDYMFTTFNIFELATSTLLISSFILYDVFQRQLKSRAEIGYGKSPFPYIFGLFAIIYPITNILYIAGIDVTQIVNVFAIIRTLAYIATILEILVYFDLLRRFDHMQKLPDDQLPKNVEN